MSFSEQGGNKTEPFGPNPKGIATWDASGNFSHILFPRRLAEGRVEQSMAPTPEEAKPWLRGCS